MKIQGPNQVNPVQAYQRYNSGKDKSNSSLKNSDIDHVEISPEAQSKLAQIENESVDTEKLKRISDQIAQGTYKIGSRAVAEKIYNSWFE